MPGHSQLTAELSAGILAHCKNESAASKALFSTAGEFDNLLADELSRFTAATARSRVFCLTRLQKVPTGASGRDSWSGGTVGCGGVAGVLHHAPSARPWLYGARIVFTGAAVSAARRPRGRPLRSPPGNHGLLYAAGFLHDCAVDHHAERVASGSAHLRRPVFDWNGQVVLRPCELRAHSSSASALDTRVIQLGMVRRKRGGP